jgi:hypothetical protein
MKYYYTKKNGEIVEKECDFDIKAYNTEYYQKHKNHLNERLECPCGLTYARCNYSAHKKGRVHSLWVKLTIKEIDNI